jgi:hypothetical protein
VTSHEVILALLDILGPAVVRHAELYARVRAMVAEGRDPSPEEWSTLFTGLRDAGARLAAAVAAHERRAPIAG